MKKITIYTSKLCGYCSAAKRLLRQKGAAYTEIDITFNRASRAEMMSKTDGRHTTPQIFIGEAHVGGCDELYALDDAGELEGMLAA